MKSIFKLVFIITVVSFFWSCQDDDKTFGDVVAPSNLQVDITVASDQSGNVTLLPSADNAINFHVYFVSGVDPVVVSSGQEATFRYTQVGEYSQEIQVIAFGTGGASSSLLTSIDLDVVLTISPETLFALAGNGSKSWVWDQNNGGHFGVGDPAQTFPDFFSAAPNELNACLYDDVLTFSFDESNNFTFNLDSGDGETFINWAEVKRFFPDATPGEFVDECRDLTDLLEFNTDFSLIEEGESRTLSVTNSTLSYWSGATSYQILELTENKLVVRGIQNTFDPSGTELAWYHTFVPAIPGAPGCAPGGTGEAGSGNNDVLVWSDEFEFDGAPCPDNWTYDIGNGCPDLCGWGNGESQYYTDRPANVIVEDGVLKLTARAEAFEGFDYTSARLLSKDIFAFQYGRVEVRAKLPTGGGTWPAIWMLGADIDTNPWPGAGEIDIMEHVGNNQDVVSSALHFPGNSGGDAIFEEINIPGASTEFHIYAVEWTASTIIFSVDGVEYHTFNNSDSVPFNKDFFMLLNVAMGGTFGGAIDPAFTESTMEIDYVRVYQ